MPGLGESISADQKYIELYKQVLPTVDVAVWIIAAGDRQLTIMQRALQLISIAMDDKYLDRIVFAVNKADIMQPIEWNDRINLPSETQLANLQLFADNVKAKILEVHPSWQGTIITYSALKNYNTKQLLVSMLQAADKRRIWLIKKNMNIASPFENVDPKLKAYALEMLQTKAKK